jgi:hypothetical protein
MFQVINKMVENNSENSYCIVLKKLIRWKRTTESYCWPNLMASDFERQRYFFKNRTLTYFNVLSRATYINLLLKKKSLRM